MAIVSIRINGRGYDVACDDGQEDHLRSLANDIDGRIRELIRAMGTNPGDSMTMLLTSLTMADELAEHKKENKKIKSEVHRLAGLVNEDQKLEQEERMVEIENAMAVTLDEIALRIEKIAQQIEMS